LVEAVCVKIEADLDSNAQGNDGDLVKLFNRVRKLLNLDPGWQDIEDYPEVDTASIKSHRASVTADKSIKWLAIGGMAGAFGGRIALFA
jgi:hypothetical protein